MAAYFVSRLSDLKGATNPTGILAVSYLRLKRLLDAGAPPSQLVRALFSWMDDQKIPTKRLRDLLQRDPGSAYEELCALVNKRISPKSLPPDWDSTLRRLLSVLAAHESRKLDRQTAARQAHLARFRTEAALKLVNGLLCDGRTTDSNAYLV